ncbi:MAG: response regulator, partial [Proteobacteria bacterium]
MARTSPNMRSKQGSPVSTYVRANRVRSSDVLRSSSASCCERYRRSVASATPRSTFTTASITTMIAARLSVTSTRMTAKSLRSVMPFQRYRISARMAPFREAARPRPLRSCARFVILRSEMQLAEAPARVLVVDDDRMSQMVLVRNLRQAGYEVDASSDGADALAQLRARPFDLVILDYLMPGMDGYEVLGEITADESLRQVPVVVVSGVGDVANAATLVEAGAADYLTKPVDSGLLRARASRCIEAKRMREREQKLYA